VAGLLALTGIALFIHGYHPYAEDTEIYLPGVLKILHPSLFPFNTEFFSVYAGHSLYPNLIAASIRISHLPVPWATLLWHIASIFLMLAGTWRIATALFENERARWASMALMAALLTLPVAGTALYILDQYLNPRSLAAFAAIFGMAEVLHRRYTLAALWLVFGAAMQPFMASFAIAFCVWLILIDRYQPSFGGLFAILPFGITLDPPPPAYHEVALRQSFHFFLRWTWYEWIGVLGPLVLFWWSARFALRRRMKNMELVSRAIVPFVLVATVAAVILSIPARFEALARLQPLRCLALTYMLLIVIGGGLLGEYVLRAQVWRWLALFVPLSLGMYLAQRTMFPASNHIEWPWTKPRNGWEQAFIWIRNNTPENAFFALDPDHMALPGEDEMGFRACAGRSMLADLVKDKGAASMFPPLATKWLEQVHDQRDWKNFSAADFKQLRQKYGVNWLVLEQPAPPGMACPYQNSAVRVCRIE
jgi:hypothetical protein